MEIFGYMEKDNYEQLVFCQDKNSGLKAIIAIHDTTLGPALGGARMWTYASEEEAIVDVLRLAKGMTYKNAAAGSNLGVIPCLRAFRPQFKRTLYYGGRCRDDGRGYGYYPSGDKFCDRNFIHL